jgi:hypothetical protein
MKTGIVLVASLAVLSACGRSIASAIPGGSPSAATAEGGARRDARTAPRGLRGVPPGHYPRAGQCRVWYEGRPPGQQPRPTACSNLIGRVPDGAFILHNGKAWDSQYDWRAHARRHPGSVPDAILELAGRNRD